VQLLEQRDQHRRVPGLARRDGDHQGQAAAIDQMVELGRETAAGAAEAVIRRLDQWILVVR
jgi:hypothetical protein